MENEAVLLNKVLDASSNTIWDELKKIKESSEIDKRNIRRRWIWELIQNASDCTPKDEKIDVKIDYSNNKITFSHNGLPFSYENLLDLVTQISSKQSSEEKKTGKFGTGFMSTHLLSDVVQIQSSLIQDRKYKKLDFTVDRSGEEYKDIKNKTKMMLEQLTLLNNNKENLKETYDNTKFIYLIEDEEILTAVEEGISDFKETIPYVLIFNENINSITYNGDCYMKVNEKKSSRNKKIKYIQVKGSDCNKELLILKGNDVTIACTIECKNNKLYFLPNTRTIPKIFCEFPLLGTEDFSFPIVVNSKNFEVERDRNAIRESNTVNHELVKEAIALYKELIDYCSTSRITRNEFNICMLKDPSSSVIQKESYKEIMNYIEKSSIIPVYSVSDDIERKAFKDNDNNIRIAIPKTKEKTHRDLLWEILSNHNKVLIPTKSTYSGWAEVFGENISFEKLNDNFKGLNTEKILVLLKSEVGYTDWLNSFYSYWIRDAGCDEVVKKAFVPNQNNEFVKLENIYFDDNLDTELKEILMLLGVKIKEQLLNQEIVVFQTHFEEHPQKVKTNMRCSEEIDIKISELLGKETIDRVERKKSTQKTFNRLTNWFLANPEKSVEWFENLYPKRSMLSSPEENLRRYKIAEKIEENNIRYEELDEIISNRERVMQIINDSELSRDDIVEQLKHIVTSSEEMKLYVDDLIVRSTENIFEYLSLLGDYILPETLEKWKGESYSNTVFPAKYKGEDIRIIVRPSDFQKIIFYYDEELEALDDYAYQLWTDDGENQRMVTLGDLLKTTGISKIPLTKI